LIRTLERAMLFGSTNPRACQHRGRRGNRRCFVSSADRNIGRYDPKPLFEAASSFLPADEIDAHGPIETQVRG